MSELDSFRARTSSIGNVRMNDIRPPYVRSTGAEYSGAIVGVQWQADPMDEILMRSELHGYLRSARAALVWKLDGLGEYDIRRPMTRTGTNLLGLVKHVAMVESGYLGDVFGRPWPEPWAALEPDAEPNADMWATAKETREDVLARYRRVWAHADATVEELPLDATGEVPWWPAEGGRVTMHRILVHVTAETNRHAGHADIVREQIDGAAGLRADNGNLPEVDPDWWEPYRERLEQLACQAAR